MRDLLDSHVWLALSSPAHIHHLAATKYWRTQAASEVVFNRLTSLALVRLLTHRSTMGADVLSGEHAWHQLRRWRDLPEVTWMEELEGIDEMLTVWCASCPLKGGDWTDAYLAAFALTGHCRLVTFDKDFRRFSGLTWLHLGPP